MRVLGLLSILIVLGLAASVGGCGSTQPYVYNKEEFNRDSRDFGKEPKDRKSVSICYSKYSTTPQDLLNLAQETCGKYNRVARFKGHGLFLTCPLFTPALAEFACDRR